MKATTWMPISEEINLPTRFHSSDGSMSVRLKLDTTQSQSIHGIPISPVAPPNYGQFHGHVGVSLPYPGKLISVTRNLGRQGSSLAFVVKRHCG